MPEINLVFPHQLFQHSPLLGNSAPFYIVEEFLFFRQYNFHKQKIAFHRAGMKYYQRYLIGLGKEVFYIEAVEPISDVRILVEHLKASGVTHINYMDPVDDWLHKRLKQSAEEAGISLSISQSLLFLNTRNENEVWFDKSEANFLQNDFYIYQRKKTGLYVDEDGKPVNGKWSFDTENRKKYPTKKMPPPVFYNHSTEYYKEAVEYTNKHFANNIGQVSQEQLYPVQFEDCKNWLKQFFEYRFAEFGVYQDSMVRAHPILHHSVISPLLNTGLITVNEVLDELVSFTNENAVPFNSVEGFLRQLIGWREFVRGVYDSRSVQQRTQNFFGFTRKIPASFYTGTTGIEPIDVVIKKVLQTGYCHHIERLMVLGNFMLLCEFDPDEVYRWFMEMFIDAYDWVMVPNIYGMSQFADGGIMATKTYISGSNYIMKMSDFRGGEWEKIWNGLFWRFVYKQRDFFLNNPRLNVILRNYERLPAETKQLHLQTAERFLQELLTENTNAYE